MSCSFDDVGTVFNERVDSLDIRRNFLSVLRSFYDNACNSNILDKHTCLVYTFECVCKYLDSFDIEAITFPRVYEKGKLLLLMAFLIDGKYISKETKEYDFLFWFGINTAGDKHKPIQLLVTNKNIPQYLLKYLYCMDNKKRISKFLTENEYRQIAKKAFIFKGKELDITSKLLKLCDMQYSNLEDFLTKHIY